MKQISSRNYLFLVGNLKTLQLMKYARWKKAAIPKGPKYPSLIFL